MTLIDRKAARTYQHSEFLRQANRTDARLGEIRDAARIRDEVRAASGRGAMRSEPGMRCSGRMQTVEGRPERRLHASRRRNRYDSGTRWSGVQLDLREHELRSGDADRLRDAPEREPSESGFGATGAELTEVEQAASPCSRSMRITLRVP